MEKKIYTLAFASCPFKRKQDDGKTKEDYDHCLMDWSEVDPFLIC